ncbi:hypothetical protein WR25_18494 [Diploscapter pachys]|uniref:Uncharacterized protein n=1 Tax=Diploscapter pachys TaxID=2018661 RepID=A0A2A2JEG7_9BILA|nr:hypothetical protein WR25_18494 [Diploscapter pachys]
MAYLHNVKDPLTAEATCIAHYSLDNQSTQIDDDMEYYAEAINHANANLDPSKKTYVYSYIYSGAGPAYDKYKFFGKPSPTHSEDFMPGNKPDYYREQYEFWEMAMPA